MLVWNEQTKLLAGAIDRVSTAIAVTGVLPLISAWQSSSHGDILYNLAALYISAFSAVMIHRLARRTLKFLDD